MLPMKETLQFKIFLKKEYLEELSLNGNDWYVL